MTRSLHCLIGVLLGAAFVTAGAQSLRDPTLPPAEAGVAGAPAAASIFSFDSSATAVIVRNGRSYLAVGTRLYAPGEKLGQARIERISETEVWLRESGVLRKVPLFAGIERRAAAAPALSVGYAPDGSNRRPALKASAASGTSKAARARQSKQISDKSGSPTTSPSVAPCVGVRP
ncbi:hypothetical protein Rfer_3333 [Rhodoferax ferrireducens T118]|uniref:MSHA biogenesis protein MshK n=1 Tax=Albidiferax ferrireducens (strain ATCC BAA-621 / DSM 15236 / T118) TaxID=338969 RepID=Q21T61_ALBFT|nr:hypothetical protein [Rhodoferax ferrireducens]ABD71042.1 hypothetical protein Rfer_3333 [Rhodoferax ferrireducens T118]